MEKVTVTMPISEYETLQAKIKDYEKIIEEAIDNGNVILVEKAYTRGYSFGSIQLRGLKAKEYLQAEFERLNKQYYDLAGRMNNERPVFPETREFSRSGEMPKPPKIREWSEGGLFPSLFTRRNKPKNLK